MEHLRDQRGHRHNVRQSQTMSDTRRLLFIADNNNKSPLSVALVCLSFTRWTVDGRRTKEFISNEIIGSSGDYNVLKHSEDYGGHSSPLRFMS